MALAKLFELIFVNKFFILICKCFLSLSMALYSLLTTQDESKFLQMALGIIFFRFDFIHHYINVVAIVFIVHNIFFVLNIPKSLRNLLQYQTLTRHRNTRAILEKIISENPQHQRHPCSIFLTIQFSDFLHQ